MIVYETWLRALGETDTFFFQGFGDWMEAEAERTFDPASL